MPHRQTTLTSTRRRCRRMGAVLSVELLFTLAIFLVIVLAIVEFGFLLVGQYRLQVAAHTACREASLPKSSAAESKEVVEGSVQQALDSTDPEDAEGVVVRLQKGQHTGDPVEVELRVPMKTVAPDLLRFAGLSLEGRYLTARCVLRME